MLKVCDNAAKVLRQLNITLESYDSLMKQLEVDISLVETEKKNVTELLEDYVQNIHKNLEKIGRNSTIKIREKSIKMLKVILPVWEDNEKLYSLRLSDLVDEITEEGIRLFENNENAQEYIGRKVTSKNLYDTVVGTGNVQEEKGSCLHLSYYQVCLTICEKMILTFSWTKMKVKFY